jgi:hypothetical protein
MDSTLTPMVAQSSVDASLSSNATVPFCGAAVVGPEPLSASPPPQPATMAAIALIRASLEAVEFMTKLLVKVKSRAADSAGHVSSTAGTNGRAVSALT